MPFRFLCILLFGGIAQTIASRAQAPLDLARSTVEKWVETRQLISRTRSEWQSDKEMLELTIQLLERELKGIDEGMGKVSVSNSQAEKEQAQAEAQLKESNEELDLAKSISVELETRVGQFVPRLPAPLQELLKPLLNRLPADSANTRMSSPERMQALVGILNEIDKFNAAVAIFSEKRRNPQQEEIAVQTLYVGLGAAYFVNDAGDFAGSGQPGSNGWDWTINPELAKRVAAAIKMYRNEIPARFLALPASVK